MQITISANEAGDPNRGIYCIHGINVSVDSWDCGKELARKAADAAVEVIKKGINQ